MTRYFAVNTFDYDEFYGWCKKMAKNNIVLVSEYSMPEGFREIWRKQVKVCLDSSRLSGKDTVERLFITEG